MIVTDITATNSRITLQSNGIAYSLWLTEAASIDSVVGVDFRTSEDDFYPVFLLHFVDHDSNKVFATQAPQIPDFGDAEVDLFEYLVAPWFTIPSPGAVKYQAPTCGW